MSDLLRDLPKQIVPIADLRPSFSPRQRGEDPAHVRLLVETGGGDDPLLVHRPTMRVIDGAHRLRAAAVRGRTEIPVQFFDGSEADAFVLSVQLNVRHGLPLTLDERKAAVRRILGSHPHWSDRAIAARTGLSAYTVGDLRRRAGRETAPPNSRIGRDGKVRPVSSIEGRRSAAALLMANSEISLRELSRRTGLSVGTVRDVRDRLSRGQDPIPQRLQGARNGPAAVATPSPGQEGEPPDVAGAAPPSPTRGRPGRPRSERATAVETASAVRKLARDPSMRATESRRTLLRILLATEMDQSQWEQIAEAIPPHCVPLIRAIVLKRCEDWKKLANMVPRHADQAT
ncbi:hypothetical protein HNP84_002135 [Thermocatellispora tengchongensis]|uniref:ParB-like N-terminal domain-containing protein n=2 Tax=Thermocatellispora tengchongensis TaxID=1073253 RepID=A0A840P0A8_9ACTN|nr:winged helix-turn-helix transcriptional regulator [Thermocatellispora tengchongensis]MBB5132419.1 hypothetical protein [Thermocatellispora tengchongensis]